MAYGPTSIGGYMAISPATKEDIGGVKIGAGIDVVEDGTISINISVDTVFPVGSIYLSKNNTSPAALFGGTWVKIAENRAIMGASYSHAAGTTVEPGLPNITGDSWLRPNSDAIVENGPFYLTDIKERNPRVGTFNGDKASSVTVGFDASKSNPIYGTSNTMQPAALYINIWERVADDSKNLPTTGSSDERADGEQGEDAL